MGFEDMEGPSFEQYDETEVMSLIGQGWEMDADGLDEDEAYEMSQQITQENRVFVKEDGTCTILVKQMGAIEEMSQGEYGQNPQDLRDGLRDGYNDRVSEVMGDNTSQR